MHGAVAFAKRELHEQDGQRQAQGHGIGDHHGPGAQHQAIAQRMEGARQQPGVQQCGHVIRRDRAVGHAALRGGHLDQGLTGLLGNPGLITFDEYHRALQCLCPSPETDLESAVRNAFVLLLTFRFGLRGGEAISLGRSDWVAVTSTVPSPRLATLVAGALHAPPAQVGAGTALTLPITTLTGSPFSEQVPVTPPYAA